MIRVGNFNASKLNSIPLSECDCNLRVYAVPRADDAEPILHPELIPLDVEKYQEIPGAEIVFPQPGAYELEITGTAKDKSFSPFELTYTVNIGLCCTRGALQSIAPALSTKHLDFLEYVGQVLPSLVFAFFLVVLLELGFFFGTNYSRTRYLPHIFLMLRMREPPAATKPTTRFRKSTHGAYAPSAKRACPEGAVVI